MRYRFLILVLCTLAKWSQAKEWLPEYRIVKETRDTSLKGDFIITFRFNGVDKGTEILMSYNKKEVKFQPRKYEYSLQLKAGKYEYVFSAGKAYNEVKSGEFRYKEGFRYLAEVDLYPSNLIRVVEKPVIYLYPEKTSSVSVILQAKGNLKFTYPSYEKGWDFIVDSDGEIHKDGKIFNYLFWDAEIKTDPDFRFKEGFVVEKENLVSFMEEKLGMMGLSAAEKEDFITYWCPRMSLDDKVLLQFKFNEACNEFAELNVNPKPDHVFRVYVLWRRAFKGEKYPEQKIEKLERNGFCLVEWGGMELVLPKNICE